MASAEIEALIAAAGRTVDWLLREQREDGSFGPERQDLAYYYKAPSLLSLAGHARAADRLIDYVAQAYQQRDGSFRGEDGHQTKDTVLPQYAGYIDGWLAIAAQRMGRFDIARPAWAHLRRFAHPREGGFCMAGPARGDGSDVIELLTTAHLGLTALYCGELPLALSAGQCLRTFWERQPAADERLYLRMDDHGDLITDFPEDQAALHVIERSQPHQAWFFVGYPIAFLVQLTRATATAVHMAAANLDTAESYADFALGCHESIFSDHSAHKVGWGLGLLAWADGEPRFGQGALKIAKHLVDTQSETGQWQGEGPEYTSFDQSVEAARWLIEMAVSLP
ncbi:hypothetical protein G6O69_01480 [Pseudenhygromyxa sp. WMMC2535]|uniref:hypothetical protein n=1 Tax=Pseudenhygromyxa sp. WMMC2535 TaxID=2712867 RepID=UPI00155409A5|nr:hypothetical protein [Pseudenhygromyxa sp. WMMC2535]NVB36484.1 hypothetical protein [Pseudenhygromyxa sp. WMMC2535]